MNSHEQIRKNLIILFNRRNKSNYLIGCLSDRKRNQILENIVDDLCEEKDITYLSESDVLYLKVRLGLYGDFQIENIEKVSIKLRKKLDDCLKQELSIIEKIRIYIMKESKNIVEVTVDNPRIEILKISYKSIIKLKRYRVERISDLVKYDENQIRKILKSYAQEVIDAAHESGYRFINELIESGEHVISEDDPIELLQLSTRPYKALRRAGYTKIKEILVLTKYDMQRIHGLGPEGINEVLTKLKMISFNKNSIKSQQDSDKVYKLNKKNE